METPFIETPTSLTHTLRPMGIGDLLDRVIYFYRTHFVALLAFTSLLIVPPTLLSILISLPSLSFMADPSILEESPGLFFSSFGLSWVGSVIFSLGITYFIMPLLAAGIGVAMQGFLLEGRRVGLLEMITGMRNNIRPMATTGLVAMIFSFASFITFPLVPVWAAIVTLFTYAFYLSLFVTLYEKRAGLEALRRGWILIRGSVWRALGYLVLFYFFSLVFGGIVGGVMGASLLALAPLIDTADSPFLSLILQSLAQGFTNVLTLPLLFGTTALLYFDLRIRHEGLDVA
ncbi:MAG: hypothetical protein H0T73_06430, partial [Ardenticatenales bacterium]|nr:hypothetical protein [Ardenticatenales bacterium]